VVPWLLLDLPLAANSLSLLPVTKTGHLISTMKDVRHDTVQEIPFCRTFGKYHVQWILPEIPVINQTHPIQNSHFILLIQTFVWSSNQCQAAAQSVKWQGYMLEDLGFKSWQMQQNYLFSKTFRPVPAPSLPPTQWNPSFFSGSKVASADSLTTHIRLEPSFQISGAIPPLNLSPSMAHIGTTLFYPNHLPLYISLNRSHPFWSYKGTFLYITFPLHSHYMTHLFHLHWSNYINIMNSYNNKLHYIIFCVLLLLTPSTGLIFSW